MEFYVHLPASRQSSRVSTYSVEVPRSWAVAKDALAGEVTLQMANEGAKPVWQRAGKKGRQKERQREGLGDGYEGVDGLEAAE
jgi:hypothetical protein